MSDETAIPNGDSLYVLASQLYEYRWNRMGRKGRICRVLNRGKLNSCLVEFTDGFKMVTSRNAIKRLNGHKWGETSGADF